MAKAVAEDYKSSLLDLNCNSKPHITMLTMIAEENIKYSSAIVDTIVDHIMEVHPSLKLPCLYLVDSIMKNIGKQYLTLFSDKIISLFSAVFEKVDESTRSLLFKLRQTWSGILSEKLLYNLDLIIRKLDPAWPVLATHSHFNLQGVNIGTQKETVPISSKVIELEKERKLCSKKDMLNQLVEKRKKLQFDMNSETSTKSTIEKVPFRAIKDGLKVMSKDKEISIEDEPFQKHVMETGDFTHDFSFQQTMHNYEKVSKTQEINTTSFLKHISKTKNRKEGVNLKSNRAFFKKHFRRKNAKLGFSEWEQTRKKLMKCDEKISNDTPHNVCSNKQEIETVNQCFDSKHKSDSKLKDLNLNQNSLIDKGGICESIPKENTSITNITTHNKTDLNTSDSSTFNEPISRKIDVTFNTMQPEKLNIVLASEICNIKESPMLADKQISLVETNENKVNERNKKTAEKSEPIDQASESFNALENVNEDISKTSVKRDFKSVEDTLTKEEIPEKIPRLESCENDQFSTENDQVLFGHQDQDLRRPTDQDFKGWDQYKEVYPDEFGSSKVACKNLEGKQKSLKISSESNSSCDDALSLQFVKEYFLTRMNQHKELHSREMVRRNEHYTADCFDPFLYIQKAEESYRKGEMSAAKFMELLSGNCQEFNKMFSSHFQNNEKTKESQKIESKGVIPSTSSWENCPLSPQTVMIKGTREFILDGQKRTIHFIGNRAFIIFDNGEPHELTFKGEQKSIHIEGLPNPILLNFDGKSAEFEINGKRHTICLGIPTREVYIDNQPHEIKFGGPPLMADLGDGRLCKIFASGPAPQVVIGTEPCFDIVNKFHPSTIKEKCDIKHPEKNECVDEHEDAICENKDFKDVDMRQKPPELHSLLNSDSESLSDVDWRQANVNKFNDRKSHAVNEEPELKYIACQPLAAYEKLNENQESHKYQEENSWNHPTDKSPSHNLKLHKHSEIHSNYPVAEEERCNRNFYPHWNDSRWPEQQWKRRPNEFREPHTFPPPYSPSNQHSEYHQTYTEFQDARGHRFNPSHSSHEDDGYNSQMNYAKSRPYNRRSGRGARYGFRGSWKVRERNINRMNTLLEQPQNQQFHVPPPGLLPQISNLVSTSGQPSFREAFEEHVSLCSSEENLNSKVPDVDVDSLMKKLLAAGIINSKPEELKHKADEIKKSAGKMEQDSPKTEENIPPILLKSECLKVYNGPVISALHRGFQCDSCGLRFSDLKKESYSKHLDWHFRMNRRERSSLKKVSFQHWYYEIEDWIQFEEFDVPDEKSKNFFELQSEELKEETKVPVPSVPATKSETELCTACNEPFQLVWMENEEEWHLHNSVIYEDDVFHPACLVDFKKEKELKVIKDLDFVDPLPVDSNSESHDDDLKDVDSEIELALYDLITQITTGCEMMDETGESLLMCSTDDIKKENDEELVLNQTPLDPKIDKKEDPVESDLNTVKQDLDILEGKPGEEEIIGVISEADTESDHDLFTEESKMVTMHSGGITLKVKAERLKQTPSSIGTINSSVSTEVQESDDDFRPPTPDPRFQVMPFVKKGKELSGLCVII